MWQVNPRYHVVPPRRTRVVLAASAAACLVLGVTAATASAASDAEATVQITSSQITSNGGPGGDCTWDVDANVTATDLSGRGRTVTTKDFNDTFPVGSVTWSDAGGSGVVSVIHPGVVWWNGHGMVAFSNSTTGTLSDVTFTIPCDATSGQLTIDFQFFYGVYPALQGPEVDVSASDTFLVDGAPLPVFGAAAGLLAAIGFGGALLIWQRRRRKSPRC